MPLIKAFTGLRPVPGQAAAVAAPPYDVLSSDEARARAAGKPYSFLHVSKPEIDLPPGTDPHAPEVYARAASNLAQMIATGVLKRDPGPCYYAYRLTMHSNEGDHVQTGLVAAASVAAYDAGRIKKHEFTRPDKEDDRVHQITATNAQTGPVLLAYPRAPAVDALLRRASEGEPAADVTADDGIRHRIWVISAPDLVDAISAAVEALPALYIADGHHRSAAASRVCAERAGRGESGYFLAVIFPHHEMRIMAYNRVVTELQGLEEEAFLRHIAGAFSIEPASPLEPPSQHGEFRLYLPGRWFKLSIRPELLPTDPVASLDVSLLSEHLLSPILGIADLRRDKRVDFVGGMRGLAELKRRVDSGEMAAAFALFPTRMEDLMAVADAGCVMPPKSTWFEPKLADGLVSHVLD